VVLRSDSRISPGSDSRAVDLAPCLNLGSVRQGWWGLGGGKPCSLEKNPESRLNALRAFWALQYASNVRAGVDKG